MEEERINFGDGDMDYATDMPIWKLALLLVAAFGIYAAYWIYFI